MLTLCCCGFDFVVEHAVLEFWLHCWLCGCAVLTSFACGSVTVTLLLSLRSSTVVHAASLLARRFCGSDFVVDSVD